MTHLTDRTSAAATAFWVLALALAAASPAAAQPRVPSTTTWYALPGVVPAGTTVVVRTRDGQSTKGRVSSLSDTAIVLEGGRVRSFPAADVVSIEGPREGRAVKPGAMLGVAFGSLFGLGMVAPALTEGSCDPEERVTWTDALIGALALPAIGAGIGAGIGLMVPGKHKQTMTIPAADVASIEDRRGRRRVGKGAAVGATVGIFFAVMMAGSAMSTEFCDCDNGTAAENALLGALVAPAIGAGVGAGIGLMVPGRRAVLYRQPVGSPGVSLAPIAGRGRRGVAVRVVF
jgi:hypothetical protein